jgi:signal peptidase II
LTPRRSKDLFFYFIALLVVAADQWSKYWVRNHLQLGVPWDPIPWLRPIVSLTYVTNTGVVFGMFQGVNRLFAGVMIVVIVAILYFYYTMPIRTWSERLSFGLLLGGAFGNLVDRLWRGRVTDFFDLNFWPMQDWAVFNVADSSVVVGTCLLIAYVLREMLWTSRQSAD